jgi:two-component system KDP operon response regulator KdpE
MQALVIGGGARRFALDVASALHLGWSEASVEQAFTIESALDFVARSSPQVIVVNCEAAGIDWLSIVRRVRSMADAVIIVVAQDYDEGDLIEAVDAGADDYLQVPLQRAVFVARVRSAFRRAHGWRNANGHCAVSGDLQIDPDSYLASVNGASLHLTPTEFQILLHLTQRSGMVTRTDDLCRTIWHEQAHYSCGATLRKYIQQLRRKLGECPECKTAIVTVPGVGYRLISEQDQQPVRNLAAG